VIPWTLKHLLILRLLMCYRFESARSLQNLLFLASAEKTERQQLGIYDFVRTRTGAYSRTVRRILDELKNEGLILEKPELCLTDKGREIYCSLGASLNPFFSFWSLCVDIVERYGGNPENLNRAVFYNLIFRRAKLGEKIFPSHLW